MSSRRVVPGIRAALVVVALLSTSLLGACTKAALLRADVTVPARVPAFVMPSIWVVGGKYDDDNYLLDRVAAQLAKDPRREVRRLTAAELAAARAGGGISPLSIVLTLDLTLSWGSQRTSEFVPMQYCGVYGCSTQYQSYVEDTPWVRGDALLVVSEAATGRELQRDRSTDKVQGNDEQIMHAALVDQFERSLTRPVDVHATRETWTLLFSKLERAQRGVELLLLGKADQGRSALEQASRQLGGKDREAQARVWYDLGVARYIAPGPQGTTASSIAAARRAFVWAVKCAPDARNRQAVERMDDALKRQAVLAEQQRAAAYNLTLVP